MVSTVTTKNTTSIPVAISRPLGIRPGRKLDWSPGGKPDELIVKVIPDRVEQARRLFGQGRDRGNGHEVVAELLRERDGEGSTVNLLLDTSALLNHFLKDRAGRVQDLLADESDEILIASVRIAEFPRRLAAVGTGWPGAKSTSLAYASLVDRVIPVDTAAAVWAFELSSVSRQCIPQIDAIIAACASLSDAVLVHRDALFGAIPADLLQRIDLDVQAPNGLPGSELVHDAAGRLKSC